jgi:hypothetical protein
MLATFCARLLSLTAVAEPLHMARPFPDFIHASGNDHAERQG